MNNLIEYQGYKAKIEYSADDELFVGSMVDIDAIVTFHGTTIKELKNGMRDSVEFHIEVSNQHPKTS